MKQILELKLTIANLHLALTLLEKPTLKIEEKILLNENRYKLASLHSYSQILLKSIELIQKTPNDEITSY